MGILFRVGEDRVAFGDWFPLLKKVKNKKKYNFV